MGDPCTRPESNGSINYMLLNQPSGDPLSINFTLRTNVTLYVVQLAYTTLQCLD